MKILSDYIGQKLEIVQPSSFKRYFELSDSNNVLAKMSYPKVFSNTALVEGEFTGSWEIAFPNFFRGIVDVTKLGMELPSLRFRIKVFKKDEVEISDITKFYVKYYVLKSLTELQDETGTTLLSLSSKFSFKTKIEVTVNKASNIIDKFPVIIFLLVYIREHRKNSSHAIQAHG